MSGIDELTDATTGTPCEGDMSVGIVATPGDKRRPTPIAFVWSEEHIRMSMERARYREARERKRRLHPSLGGGTAPRVAREETSDEVRMRTALDTWERRTAVVDRVEGITEASRGARLASYFCW